MDNDRDRLDGIIKGDRGAFASQTARNLPDMMETERTIRARMPRPRRTVRRVALAGAAFVAAAVLLLVPVSYPTLVGGTVSLAIEGDVTPAAKHEIARGLLAGIGGEVVDTATPEAGATVLGARARGSLREIRASAKCFADGLRRGGLPVTVSVSPWFEGGTGNVYAFASERVRLWWIDVRGRAPGEIEADLRARLVAIGYSDAAISVRRDGNRIEIDVRARDGRGRELETEFARESEGEGADEPVGVDVELPDMSDLERLPLEDRRDAVEKRLHDHGIDARVAIVDGKLRVERDESIERK